MVVEIAASASLLRQLGKGIESNVEDGKDFRNRSPDGFITVVVQAGTGSHYKRVST
jgi:hypothetical protein